MSSKTYNFDIKMPTQSIPDRSLSSYVFINAFGIWNNNTHNLTVNKHFSFNLSENNDKITMCYMFANIKHKNEFEIWYKKYMMFFDDSNYLISLLPISSKSRQIQGYFYYQSPNVNNDNLHYSYLTKQFYYIVEHFDPPVYLIDKTCWLLKNEQEAIILKLNT